MAKRNLTAKQIAAGFGGKAAQSRASGKRKSGGGSRAKAKGGGHKRQKTWTVRALDVAAGGGMLLALNADKVAARAFAVAQKQVKPADALMGSISDVYSGARQNYVTLAMIPMGLKAYRRIVGTGKTVKVPFIPLRLGA